MLAVAAVVVLAALTWAALRPITTYDTLAAF